MKKNTAILLVYCKDRPGLVNRITGFIQNYGGNILYLDQHADHEEKNFFMRIEWDLEKFTLPEEAIKQRGGGGNNQTSRDAVPALFFFGQAADGGFCQ